MPWFARYIILRIGKRATDVELSPWRQCLESLFAHWGVGTSAHVEAPQWFVEDDDKGADDETLYGSEATGYWPILEPHTEHCLPKYASSDGPDDSHYSVRVLNWLGEVMHSGIKPLGIPKLAQPSTKGSRVDQLAKAAALPKGDYSNSPCRRICVARLGQAGAQCPSQTSTSSDWTLFYYDVYSEVTCVPQHQTYAPQMNRFSRRVI